jgi:hypothetical protein
MKTKGNKMIYWGSTGLLSAMMLMSAGMYFFNHEMVAEMFTSLGYPTYIIYPLAIAKLLGITAILTKKSKTLKEWAYAGFFYDFLLAASAHIMVQDGGFAPALVAMLLLAVSYFYDKKVFKS